VVTKLKCYTSEMSISEKNHQ